MTLTSMNFESLKGEFLQAKLLVKKWEDTYKKSHGSKPNKGALSEAPEDIKDAYKFYWKYFKQLSKQKKSLSHSNLEQGVKSNDNDNDTSFVRNNESNAVLAVDKSQQNNSVMLSVENNQKNTIVEDSITNDIPKPNKCSNVWGSHLNKAASDNSKKFACSEASLYYQIAQRMKSNHTVIKTPLSFKNISNRVKLKSNGSGDNINHPLRSPLKQTSSFNVPVTVETLSVPENLIFNKSVCDNDSQLTEPFTLSAILASEGEFNYDSDSLPLFTKKPKIEKKQMSAYSQSISLFSQSSPNKNSKLVPRKYDKNWLNRCTKNNLIESLIEDTVKLDKSDITNQDDDERLTSEIANNVLNNRFLPSDKRNFDLINISDSNVKEHPPFKRKYDAEESYETDMVLCKKLKHSVLPNKMDDSFNFKASKISEEYSHVNSINNVSNSQEDINLLSANKVKIGNCKLPENKSKIEKEMLCKNYDNPDSQNETESLTNEKIKNLKVKVQKKRSNPEQAKVRNRKLRIQNKEMSKKDNSDDDAYIYPTDDEDHSENEIKHITKIKPRNIKCNQQNKKPMQKELSKEKLNSEENSESNEINKEEYNELLDMENSKIIRNSKPTVKRKCLTKEERLQNKVNSGKLNENYLKINLKKKVFVRGQKRLTCEKYKRQEWKKKQISMKADGGDERSIKKMTCFRCGVFGHWASKCPGKIGDSLMPVEDYDENESIFLSLDEAADLARGIKTLDDRPSSSKLYLSNSEGVSTSTEKTISNETDMFNESDDDLFADVNDDMAAYDNVIGVSSQDKDSNCHQLRINVPAPSNDDKFNISPEVPPIYQSKVVERLTASTEVLETLKLFGHNNFRNGQEETIMRILSGQSTLLILSTGSGKSLCYQLPAYIYAQHNKCITLCVSPLVSLMEDQVVGLPSFLKAVCLHTQQNPTNREKALTALKSGKVHILLVSPEAIVSSRGGGILGTLLRDLPPVAFACIDEAHCLSEWSHNFRPSYLQVCKVLKEKLKVHTLLGLTATARNETANSIAKHLQISDYNLGIISGSCIPDNLMLSVSRDENREEALMHLLTGDRFFNCSSIIVYCTRREECERVATFIRTQLITASKVDVKNNSKRTRGISLDAEAYHAGLSGHRRQQIQKKFMSGQLRIVVATVAFGMGIDKSDVQGIIHFNMTRNLESYVQEIGRAGRDGRTAHCHLFLDSSDGRDIQELKRHIFVNSVDRFTVRKLLNKLFKPCSCAKIWKLDTESEKIEKEATVTAPIMKRCPSHELALPIDLLIELLDIPEENIQTLLCYLESNPKYGLKLCHHVYATCSVACYKGPKQLCAISKLCPPLAAAIALQRSAGVNFVKKNGVTFPVVEIAAQMGWDSGIVKQELKRLEWNKQFLAGKNVSSGVKVEFSDLAFHLTCRGDLTEEEQDAMLEELYQRSCKQEKDQLKQLQYTYEVLRKASHATTIMCCDSVDEDRSTQMKNAIRAYFCQSNEGLSSIQIEEKLYIRPEIEQRIRNDIHSFISTYTDQSWTGRAVARVFHGISSPNFPAQIWGKVRRFWRLHIDIDFNLLLALATKEILKFK